MKDAASPTIAPIQKTLVVRLSPDEAFELFTSELSRWWPLAKYSCHGADAKRVAFEHDGGWGVVLAAYAAAVRGGFAGAQ